MKPTPSSPRTLPPPTVLALIVADAIYKDPATNKHYILGTYDVLSYLEYPARRLPMNIFLVITNGHGNTSMLLRLIDADEARPPVFGMPFHVIFTDPTTVCELTLLSPELVEFPAPGCYRLQVFANGQLLCERLLTCRLVPR